MSIAAFIQNFFKRVEETPESELEPFEHELVDGKAFTIRHYPQKTPLHLASGDTLSGRITEDGEVVAEVSEPIGSTMTVDTISTLRFNDSLGYKHAVGVLFGQRRTP